MDKETLRQIRRMCEIITGNLFGNRELDSLALYVGHHPDVMNSDIDPDVADPTPDGGYAQ